MRIFLPASLSLVHGWAAAQRIGPQPLTGFAVTPGLREWYLDGEAEELEYAATMRAARASLRLISVTEPRRVVLAVDVPDDVVIFRDELEVGAIHVTSFVPWSAVACALVDDLDAEPAVAEAVAVIDAADLGDEDAEFLVSETEDHELGWYATQELADL